MEIIKLSKVGIRLAALLACTMMVGCQKEKTVAGNGIDVFKVFYDTLANADNQGVSMDAGFGRIFMTYGTSPMGTSNSYGYINHVKKTALIATDNEGQLLWKAKIPDAMEINAVVALSDQGCLLITSSFDGKNSAYSNKHLYLFRYNAQGQVSKTDSVLIVPTHSEMLTMWLMNAYINSNGNIIVYGDLFAPKSYMNFNKGWIMEYSLTSGLVWLKTHLYELPGTTMNYVMFSGCVQTPDKGYLLFGSYMCMDTLFVNNYQYPYLVKTNANGDTMWTRFYPKLTQGSIWAGNIVTAPNGHYRFCFSETPADLTKPSNMYIYEINADGDSLNAVIVNNQNENIGSKILPAPDGGCFALINSATGNSISFTRRTFFQKTATRKAYFDAGLHKKSDAPFQPLTTDFLTQACYTSNGNIACFGLQQPPGRNYYLPHLFILK